MGGGFVHLTEEERVGAAANAVTAAASVPNLSTVMVARCTRLRKVEPYRTHTRERIGATVRVYSGRCVLNY